MERMGYNELKVIRAIITCDDNGGSTILFGHHQCQNSYRALKIEHDTAKGFYAYDLALE